MLLRPPDPDTFGGTVSLSRSGAPWVAHETSQDIFGAENWLFHAPDRANYRMLAIADLAQSLRSGSQPRASGALALHVLDVMESIARALDSGETIHHTICILVARVTNLGDIHSGGAIAKIPGDSLASTATGPTHKIVSVD